jgi:hypothetical protein
VLFGGSLDVSDHLRSSPPVALTEPKRWSDHRNPVYVSSRGQLGRQTKNLFQGQFKG